MKVKVYYNLTRHVWSIMAHEGPQKGRIIAHADRVLMDGCAFVVSAAGRERVRRTGRKTVHAFVVGNLLGWDGPNAAMTDAGLYVSPIGQRTLHRDHTCGFWPAAYDHSAAAIQQQGKRVTYNPKRDDGFVFKDTGLPVDFPGDRWALLDTGMVWTG